MAPFQLVGSCLLMWDLVKERSSVIGGSGSLNIYTGSNRDTKGRKGYSRYMRINTRCIYNI